MRVMTMLTLACLCGESYAIPFEQSPRGAIVIEARLNGHGPYQMLLDTGSSHSAISADLASALGALPVERAVVASPIGESVRTIVRLDRLEIGPTVTSNV